MSSVAPADDAAVSLLLPEELLLLAFGPGGVVYRHAANGLHFGLAGAVVLELVLRDRLELSDGDLVTRASASTGDDLLDDVLDQVRNQERSIGHWVRNLSPGSIRWRDRVAERLVRQGIVDVERYKRLGLLQRVRYPLRQPAVADAQLSRLQAALFDAPPPQPRTVCLVSLAHACRLIDPIVDKARRKEAKRNAARIVEGEMVGPEVADAVRAANAAFGDGE